MLIYTSLERERILLNTIIFVTGIVQLLWFPDYPEQIFFFSISPVIWLKKTQLDIVENCVIQLIFWSGG